jgi:magnesium transporter
MIKTILYNDFSWIDILDPDKNDIEYLKTKLRLKPLTIRALVAPQYHPDFNSFKDQLNIVFHHHNFKKDGEIEFQEIDIVAQKDYLITSHYQPISILDLLFEECQKSDKNKEKYLSKRSGYLLFVLLERFLKEKIKKINNVEERINLLEKEIFSGEGKKTIKEISRLKREIINLWRGIEPQKIIFESLKSAGPKLLGEEFLHYYSILYSIHRKTDIALRTSKETIESLEETHHILVSLKMNEIISILTIFSVIILPLNLLASMWGMNTNYLPFKNSSFDFWIISALMLFVIIGMVYYFKHKKWL